MFFNNVFAMAVVDTYWNTLAVHAVHHSKRWTQIRVPGLLQLVGLSAKPTF